MRVFIGYDEVESVAYHTLSQSILEYSSIPVSVTALKQSMLPMYNRKHDSRQSNEFSFTRFLVPYLCDYEGWALFMDCDMMFRTDPKRLWDLRDPDKAIQVVKHDYTPKNRTKFLGAVQYPYPRKNWSSVMLFNCAECKDLTLDAVNNAEASYLHRFEWLPDSKIGGLPKEWNHLVGEYDKNPNACNAHWTLGGPYFNEYQDTEFAAEWFYMRNRMQNCNQLEKKQAG